MMSKKKMLWFVALVLVSGCQSVNKAQDRSEARLPASAEFDDPRPVVRDAKKFLFTHDLVTSPEQMERENLLAHELEERPWTSSYWPDRLGNITLRYKGTNFFTRLPVSRGPKRAYKIFLPKHEATAARFDQLTEEEISALSPSEKYDILVGDKDFTLTREVWDGILQEASKTRFMAIWSGICNGWASAAVNLPRPASKVVVTSPQGKKVTFYPDDIKALTSLLWAHSFLKTTKDLQPTDTQPEDVVFYGNRCNKKRPKHDRSGRTLEQTEYDFDPNECSDPNAGVWHLAIVNRIGRQKKSFVMDSQATAVIDNHPLVGYNYRYFHPRTGDYGSFASSTQKLADYANDPFKSVRTKGAVATVGVEMRIRFTNYSFHLKQENFNTRDDDKIKELKVRYDLEIDERGDVVGGQWRINKRAQSLTGFAFKKGPRHPDFMWYVRDEIKVWSAADPLEDWNAEQPFPAAWTELAVKSAKTVWKLWDADRLKYPAAKDMIEKLRKEKGMSQEDAERETIARLDELGVPSEKPYAQPLAKVVYKLIEVSAAGAKEKP